MHDGKYISGDPGGVRESDAPTEGSWRDAYSRSLALRIHKLALEERDAVRRRDWSAARGVAEERLALQEARHRVAARRFR